MKVPLPEACSTWYGSFTAIQALKGTCPMAINKAETLAALVEINDRRAAVDLHPAEARAAGAAGAAWDAIGGSSALTKRAA
jgi:hypothetical protein